MPLTPEEVLMLSWMSRSELERRKAEQRLKENKENEECMQNHVKPLCGAAVCLPCADMCFDSTNDPNKRNAAAGFMACTCWGGVTTFGSSVVSYNLGWITAGAITLGIGVIGGTLMCANECLDDGLCGLCDDDPQERRYEPPSSASNAAPVDAQPGPARVTQQPQPSSTSSAPDVPAYHLPTTQVSRGAAATENGQH